jgi:subtilisin-like proprotein convertase family protein
VASELGVPLARVITDVNVHITAAHANTSDLHAWLESPKGTQVDLFNGAGADSDDFTDTGLDDDAAAGISTGTGPFTGCYAPLGDLNDFSGEASNGTWVLHVRDGNANGITGVLNGWSLSFNCACAAEKSGEAASQEASSWMSRAWNFIWGFFTTY